MDEIGNQFANVEEAKDFINSRPDPVDREVLWSAYATLSYATLSFEMGRSEITGQVDVLFLMRILAKMLEDRGRLLRVLSGAAPSEE